MAKFKTELAGASVMGADRVYFFDKNGELETDCEVTIGACKAIDGIDEVKNDKGSTKAKSAPKE